MELGIVITTQREIYAEYFERPLCKSVGAVVGGDIELVHPRGLKSPLNMIVNEEGLLLNLPYNDAGSLFYGTPIHGNPILGDIVIMQDVLTSSGPDMGGLDDETAANFIAKMVKLLDLKEIKKGDKRK